MSTNARVSRPIPPEADAYIALACSVGKGSPVYEVIGPDGQQVGEESLTDLQEASDLAAALSREYRRLRCAADDIEALPALWRERA